jgi:hypothetical protein
VVVSLAGRASDVAVRGLGDFDVWYSIRYVSRRVGFKFYREDTHSIIPIRDIQGEAPIAPSNRIQ